MKRHIAGLLWSLIVLASCLLIACAEDTRPAVKGVFSDDTVSLDDGYDLPDIQAGGELIALTLYGPDSYFEFRGEEFGNQFRLAREFARSIGAKIRVNVCKSERELKEKLTNGEGDIIAYDLKIDSLESDFIYCGALPLKIFLDSLSKVEHDKSILTHGPVAWAVRQDAPELAASLTAWMDNNETRFFDISQPKVRNVNDKRKYTAYVSDEYFPDIPIFYDYPTGSGGFPSSYASYGKSTHAMGKISYYDHLFVKYADLCGWDWRLLAAVAYNESSFNPYAVSPMGAMGLMQLMPSTARRFGVSNAFDPEQSVRASARLFASLLTHYAAVPDPDERINFALAAYNAGPGHVDDARRLAEKLGMDKDRWFGHVAECVLFLSQPAYYNDPVAKFGYFRGGETYNYVNYIRKDWERFTKR